MPRKAALKIEQWPIEKIMPYERNARMHSADQKAKIKNSIKEFGFVNPCLVDADGVLIAGHGRVESAMELGLETIPVIRLGHLSEAQAKALRIHDNAVALRSTWSPEILESELDALREMDFDLEPLGLDDIQLPELDDDELVSVPAKRVRSKTTIFVSVLNEDAERARKAIISALERIKCSHNL